MRRKALSLLMAAVMLATAPAGVSLASETASSETVVVSEAESGAAAEESADVNEGDAASESVGTDEEPGVSLKETNTDAAVDGSADR